MKVYVVILLAVLLSVGGTGWAADRGVGGSASYANDQNSRIAQLEKRVQYLEEKLATVLQIATYLKFEEDQLDGVSGPHVLFEGVNVHVRNGLSSHYTDINGLGNLIIGYNDCPEGDQPSGVCDPMEFGRGGSHNLVVGDRHEYTQRGGLVAGRGNVITGRYASVTGGSGNLANGRFAHISGGEGNEASGETSSISGGRWNTASNLGASVSGGGSNTASGEESSVCGGYQNTASRASASISGGWQNIASGWAASASGGTSNKASGDTSSVLGGSFNEASGSRSSIGGGHYNTASTHEASVSGGYLNEASGWSSSVSGGANRSATGNSDWRAGTYWANY